MNKGNFLKKLFILICIPLFLFFLSAKPSSAFETPNLDYQFQFEEALNSDEMNLQSFVNEVMKAAMAASARITIGGMFNLNEENVSENAFNLNQNESKNSGLIHGILFVFSKAYEYQPASGINYLANFPEKLIFAEKAHAAEKEVSFIKHLTVLQPMWTTFRNISYLLFALILVFLGFAIMFRLKVSPQAVITIQLALPRLVFALILITFSYAIVGLMLDVMFFLNRIIGGIFQTMIDTTAWEGWSEFLSNIFNFLSPSSKPYIGPAIKAFNTMGVGLSYFFIYVNWVFPFAGLILTLILSIIIAIAMVRCLFVIIKSIAMIILNIIFAPLRILLGAMPGSTAITDWFKDLFSNMLILPLMLVIFYISAYLIMASAPKAVGYESGFGGGGLGAVWKSLTNQDSPELDILGILPFCGVAILLMAPKVSELIQSAMTKKPFSYGAAFGEYGTQGTRIAQAGWQKFRERSGMAIREEGKRKADVETEADKWRPKAPTKS